MKRRYRCSDHPDMLVEDHCPRCEVERLTKLNKQLESLLGIYGEKATVRVSYRWRNVLGKILQLLATPGGEWNDPSVKVGDGSGSDGGHVTLPRELAEKIAEIAKEMDEEYVKALLHGYDDGIQIVALAMSNVFERMVKHQIKTGAKQLRKVFAKDKYYRGEFNVAREALAKELFAIFDEEKEDD